MYFDICVAAIKKVLKIWFAAVVKYRINILVEQIFQDKVDPTTAY